jgi:pyruvate kinase
MMITMARNAVLVATDGTFLTEEGNTGDYPGFSLNLLDKPVWAILIL